MSDLAKQCPWCDRWCLKDDQCNYVVCGRNSQNQFVPQAGCGHAWCYQCGKKLCGRMYAEDGTLLDPNEDHNIRHRPTPDDPCSGPDYCPGGHNSHKDLSHAVGPGRPPAVGPVIPRGPVRPPAFGPGRPPAFGPGRPPAFGPVMPPAFGPGRPPAFGPVMPPTFGPVRPPAVGPLRPRGPVRPRGPGRPVGPVRPRGPVRPVGPVIWNPYHRGR